VRTQPIATRRIGRLPPADQGARTPFLPFSCLLERVRG